MKILLKTIKDTFNSIFHSSKGFTLLELLVVVVIIGVLASIALPQYRKAKDKAKYATIQPIVKAVGDAMERYYMVHNAYPLRFKDIDVSLEGGTIQDDSGHDKIIFDWGFCYFGWFNQFVCDLLQEKVGLEYLPNKRLLSCLAMDTNEDSRPYKFCANLPNSRLNKANSTCRWIDKSKVNCSTFIINRK